MNLAKPALKEAFAEVVVERLVCNTIYHTATFMIETTMQSYSLNQNDCHCSNIFFKSRETLRSNKIKNGICIGDIYHI